MERKVIDLEVIDELKDSGVDAIALVDEPAIEKTWLYFKKENFVEPKAGESESDYMGRCISYVVDEGKDQDQAVAQCISMWQQNHSKEGFVYNVFADYPWDECISDQLDKGHSEESANNICGWIKANMNSDFNFADYPWDECIQDRLDEGKDEEAANNICGWIKANMSIELAKVSFDFDDTLSTKEGLALAQRKKSNGDTLYIISARNSVGQDMLDRAKELGIPESRVFATGSNKAKVEKIRSLGIDKHIDNNQDVINELPGIGQKFEVNVASLPAYTQEVKAPLVKKAINMEKVFEFAQTVGFSAEDFTNNGMEFSKVEPGKDYSFAKGYTVYKYEGSVSGNTRDFCDRMVGLNKFYTYDEINAMGNQAVNPGFGLNGADTYSIWLYKGGPNCKHRWQKYYVTESGNIQNKGPAVGTAGTRPEDMPNSGYANPRQTFSSENFKVGDTIAYEGGKGKITEVVMRSKNLPGTDVRMEGTSADPSYVVEVYERKDGKWIGTKNYKAFKAKEIKPAIEMWRGVFADEEQKVVVGPVAIPDMEIIRKDDNGEPYWVRFSKEAVARMSEKFMREQRLSDTNIQHVDSADAGSYVFESWIVEDPASDKANTVYGLDVPQGTWCVKMRVTNPQTWARVKAGELHGFSLQGSFVTQEEFDAYQKDKKMFEDLVKLVNSI